MIVTVTPTEQGPVVQWYTNTGDTPLEEIAFASAAKMLYLSETPMDVVHAAETVHADLEADPHTDISHYATHVREGVWFRPIKVNADTFYRINPDAQEHLGSDGMTMIRQEEVKSSD